MLKNIKIIFFILIAISLNLCALNDLDKIRSNSIFVPSFTSTADQMVQEFAILLEVKLSTTREQIKSYIDAKMEGIDNKIDSLKKSSDSLSQGAKKEVSVIEQKINKLGQNLNSRLNVVAKTRRNVPVKAPARSRADDKIKEEVMKLKLGLKRNV